MTENTALKTAGLSILADADKPKKVFKVSTDAVDALQRGFVIETKTYGGKDMLTIHIAEVGTKILKVDLGSNDNVTDNGILAMHFVEALAASLNETAQVWRELLTSKGILQETTTDEAGDVTDGVEVEAQDMSDDASESAEVAA